MGRKYVSEAERKRNKENVCWNGFTSVKMKPKPPLKIVGPKAAAAPKATTAASLLAAAVRPPLATGAAGLLKRFLPQRLPPVPRADGAVARAAGSAGASADAMDTATPTGRPEAAGGTDTTTADDAANDAAIA